MELIALSILAVGCGYIYKRFGGKFFAFIFGFSIAIFFIGLTIVALSA